MFACCLRAYLSVSTLSLSLVLFKSFLSSSEVSFFFQYASFLFALHSPVCYVFVYVFSLRSYNISPFHLLFSKLIVYIQDQLAQVFIYVASIWIKALSNVLKSLKEAVEVHLSVLAATYHVLVNDIVVGLANMVIRHIFKLSETLELVRRDEVVVLLASEDFENRFSLRVEVKFIIVSIAVWQYKFE